MKIESGQIQQGLLDVGQKERAERVERDSVRDTATEGVDEVSVSDRWRQIRALVGEVGDVREADASRVSELRSRIEGGRWQASPRDVATALLGELVA